jgi:hypothetical protein
MKYALTLILLVVVSVPIMAQTPVANPTVLLELGQRTEYAVPYRPVTVYYARTYIYQTGVTLFEWTSVRSSMDALQRGTRQLHLAAQSPFLLGASCHAIDEYWMLRY